ncbi:hypothetical protein FRB99_008678, partial [Tulasnella sp. 403]
MPQPPRENEESPKRSNKRRQQRRTDENRPPSPETTTTSPRRRGRNNQQQSSGPSNNRPNTRLPTAAATPAVASSGSRPSQAARRVPQAPAPTGRPVRGIPAVRTTVATQTPAVGARNQVKRNIASAQRAPNPGPRKRKANDEADAPPPSKKTRASRSRTTAITTPAPRTRAQGRYYLRVLTAQEAAPTPPASPVAGPSNPRSNRLRREGAFYGEDMLRGSGR